MKKLNELFLICLTVFMLTGCVSIRSPRNLHTNVPENAGGYLEGDGPPEYHIDIEAIRDAVPKAEPLSKYGNPEFYLVDGKSYQVMKESKGYHAQGVASWYGKKWHGKRTSSGEPYDLAAMTAAHPTLPIPTYVKVKNVENNKEVIVKVNDRGPFRRDRLIDLSYAAAAKLGMLGKGSTEVIVDAIDTSGELISTSEILLVPTNPSPVENKYLQLGSFSFRENALALAREIEKLTHQSPQIKETSIENRPFYQVRLGPLKDDEVTNLIKNIYEAGLGQPIVSDHA
jgi:rare lipoprotein A